MHFSTGLILAALARHVLALPTIEAKGAKFFDSDGNQFYIKGIAYQLTIDDPLVSAEQCSLDSSLMKQLGANSIRVYHVDPTADHDACMKTFSDNGIYAWIDLDTFDTYIGSDDPSWTQRKFSAYAKVMDTFQKYDNVAGFFVGNEVLTKGSQSPAAPYVKAAARDMKAYRDSKGYRNIPIGYSAADIAELRPNLQNYMACGTNSSERLDFFGLNAYEWCGNTNYKDSGYAALQANASDYNIPIFFSETGCNMPEPRTFDDQTAIFGPDMDGTWSGAIIYEWIQEGNNYGLISYGTPVASTATGAGIYDGFTRTGTPTPIAPDFTNLSNQWKTLSPSGVSLSAYSPSLTAPACPAFTSGLWEVSGNVALPTIGASYVATPVAGAGSQESSGTSGSGSSQTTPTATHTPSSSASTLVGAREPLSQTFIAYGLGCLALLLGIPLVL